MTGVKVADATWIAAALLHREQPEKEGFTAQQIADRSEEIYGNLRQSVYTHANTHCVANRPPNPGGYRMLYETSSGLRRLYRETDDAHPNRHGKILPRREDIPEQYRYLLDWYETEYASPHQSGWLAGIHQMIGAGKTIFAGVDADEYVRSLREGWE